MKSLVLAMAVLLAAATGSPAQEGMMRKANRAMVGAGSLLDLVDKTAGAGPGGGVVMVEGGAGSMAVPGGFAVKARGTLLDLVDR